MAGSRHHAAAVLLLSVLLATDSEAFESCQTLGTEIVVTKEKTQDLEGRPVRLMCVGTVTTKKCEGTCMSQVSPSVVKFPGFLKDCRCCRESALEERLVTLYKCYDGPRLVAGEHANVYIKEPSDCQCLTCSY